VVVGRLDDALDYPLTYIPHHRQAASRHFLTHIPLDIAPDFWHATLQRAG
jgi:hypothetical protein